MFEPPLKLSPIAASLRAPMRPRLQRRAETRGVAPHAGGSSPRSWSFGSIPILPSGAVLQAKLTVGSVDDPFEREADRVADHVMRMPADQIAHTDASGSLRRTCSACEAEDDQMRRQSSARAHDGQPVPPAVHDVLADGGRPLDAAARSFFEPHLGMDLGHVRVHDNPRAADSARAVGARAYTVGHHIALGESADTSTDAGRRLLAHELAHVVQQTAGAP